MSVSYLVFIIPFLAGLSTIIGYFPVYISKEYQEIVISSSLSFSSGVMVMVSFSSLLPEAYSLLLFFPFISRILLLLLFFLCGGILSILLDCFFSHTDNYLYKVGLVSFGALLLHNIPEGITTFLATSTSVSLGIPLALAIAFHNIPEGIMIAVPIYYASGSRLKAFLYTLFAGFSEEFGAILAFLFFRDSFSSFFLIFILSLTAGIMSYLAFFELLPKSFSYSYKKISIFSFLFGIFLLYICIFILI